VEQTVAQVIRLDVPSSLRWVHTLYAVITEILSQMALDEESSDQINLAVVEAGTNAIKHGNQEDPEKRAYFEFVIQSDQFTVIIQDQGRGFDREQVPDPIQPENLFKSSGRGLFLIESCMDDVTYEKSGTLIRMVKKLT
jgi:serine/threonine-protein kinase RsbW